jgi:hypothetical protein
VLSSFGKACLPAGRLTPFAKEGKKIEGNGRFDDTMRPKLFDRDQ